MLRRDDVLFLKAVSPRGENLLGRPGGAYGRRAGRAEIFDDYNRAGARLQNPLHMRRRGGDCEGVRGDLPQHGLLDQGVQRACMSCGICTFVCPTCYCFDICDETQFGQGVRRRVWVAACSRTSRWRPAATIRGPRCISACARRSATKTRSTSASTDRSPCVGCGRCTRYCRSHIDIFSIVEQACRRNVQEAVK